MLFPEITEVGRSLKGVYLEPESLRKMLGVMSDLEKEAFIRQWMTEGIPYCFKDCPMAYEFSRFMISAVLPVHAKNVTLIGSGRFGFSLDPTKYGTKFNHQSDLDFSFISHRLFNDLEDDFNTWLREYKIKLVTPINEKERVYWDENSIVVPKNLTLGFIDLNKIPMNPPRYHKAKQAATVLADLKLILNRRGIVNVSKITTRIFKDWDSAIERYKLNLNHMIKKLEQN